MCFCVGAVLYDLARKTMEVFVGNPAQEKPVMQFSMATATAAVNKENSF